MITGEDITREWAEMNAELKAGHEEVSDEEMLNFLAERMRKTFADAGIDDESLFAATDHLEGEEQQAFQAGALIMARLKNKERDDA